MKLNKNTANNKSGKREGEEQQESKNVKTT